MSAPIRAARDTHAADVVFLVVLVVCAAGIGLLAASSPILALAGASVLAGLVLLSFGRRMVPVFHCALLIILIGYAFLGKGFAYLGTPPIYVGEVVLALGILAVIVSLPGARWHPIHLALAIFMGLGAIRTVPYLSTYGIDALRDGVTYGYALFAFAVSLTVRGDHLSRILALYRRVIPAYLLWVPIAAVLVLLYGSSLPVVQAPGVTIVEFKGGDAGVQLAGIGAFLLLGLGGSSSGAIRDGVLWAGWLFALAIAGAVNRGGLLAASTMSLAVLFGRSSVRWVSLVVVGLLLVFSVTFVDPQVDVGLARRVSVNQLVDNALSVFGGREDDPVLEGTRQWRLRWWDDILQYTISGPYFWDGKGFGINLADADGFQVSADGSLRAPHNGHLEILARGGVPLFLAWIAVLITYLVTMLRAAGRARRAGLYRSVGIIGWVVVYWAAALVNASFDVYLQNPMGGIWFWSMMGLGIAMSRIVDDEAADPARGSLRMTAGTPEVPAPSGSGAGG